MSGNIITAVQEIARKFRHDTYNEGWYDADGKLHYRRVSKPLTEAVIAAHCQGGAPIAAFSLSPGSGLSSVLVFDIDDKPGQNWPQVQDAAKAIKQQLLGYGLRPMVFRSGGGRGIHVWVVWDEPQPTARLCQFGRYVVEDAGYHVGSSGGIGQGLVEVLPKQHYIAAGTFGTAISLPFGRQSCWLDRSMEPCDSGEVVLDNAALRFEPDPLTKDGSEIEYGDIDADVLRKAAQDALTFLDTDDYDTWIRMAHCIKKHWGEDGFGLWLDWSKTGNKFGGFAACEKKWASIKRVDNARLRTLFKQAQAAGWRAADGLFDPIWQKKMQRTTKGVLKSTSNNVIAMLHYHPDFVQALSRSEFDRQIYMVRDIIAEPDWPIPRKVTDVDITCVQAALSHRGIEASIDLTRRAMELVAAKNPHHPIKEYLDELEWDGVPRIDRWLTDYAEAEDSPYVRAVSEKTLIAGVARIYSPGCRVDNMLTLVSRQGTKKTTFVQTLAGGDQFYVEITASMDDAAAHKMQGSWIVEMAEMASYTRTAYEVAKAFISRKVDRFRKPYGSTFEDYPRQCIFIATFNPTKDEGFLKDKTGNRRYWVVEVGKFDVEGIEAIRDQLWAEAVAAYRAGKRWWLTDEEQDELATPVQKQHEESNSYVENVIEMMFYRWQENDHGRRTGKFARSEPLLVTCLDEVMDFLSIPMDRKDRVKRFIGEALREVGFVRDSNPKFRDTKDEGIKRYWYRIDPEKAAEHGAVKKPPTPPTPPTPNAGPNLTTQPVIDDTDDIPF